MTLERTGTGTATYRAPSGESQTDVYGLASPSFDYTRKQLPGVRFETFRTGKEREIGWRFTVFDFRGGLNFVKGDIEAGHNRMKSSSLDTSFEEYGQAILPQLTTSAETPAEVGTVPRRLHGVNVLGGLVMAIEDDTSASGASLYKETSDTDPTPMKLTFSPGAGYHLMSLNAVSIGGFSSEPKLAVGFDGRGVEVFSNLNSTPTSIGTMHTSTGACSGMIHVPLPDEPLLIYSADALYMLNRSDALATAPTKVLDKVPRGGWIMGLQSLGGAPVRPYFTWPKYSFGGSLLLGDPQQYLPLWKRGRAEIWSTNSRGGDQQKLPFPLPYIVNSLLLRDGIAADDSRRIIFHNNRGYRYRDLGIFRDVSPNSDREHVVAGLSAKDGELYAEVNVIASASGSGNTTRHIRKYSFPYDTWHQVSADEILTDTGIRSLPGAGSLPVSNQTGYLHAYSNGAWKRMYAPPPGVNPYSRRQTAGAGSSTGVQFETTGEIQMGELIFPGWLGTMQKSVRRMGFLGEVDTGGAGSKVRLDAGGVFHEFRYGYAASQQVKDFERNDHRFSFLAPKVTATRGSNSRMTPQPLPFFIEGVCYDDRKAIKVISYT